MELTFQPVVYFYAQHDHKQSDTVSYSKDCLAKGLPTRPTRTVPYRSVTFRTVPYRPFLMKICQKNKIQLKTTYFSKFALKKWKKTEKNILK